MSSPPSASTHAVGVRGVGHHVEHVVAVVGGMPPHDDVVEHRRVAVVEQVGVLRSPGSDLGEIVGQRGLQSIERIGPGQPNGAEVRHVEHHGRVCGTPCARRWCRGYSSGISHPPNGTIVGAERPVQSSSGDDSSRIVVFSRSTADVGCRDGVGRRAGRGRRRLRPSLRRATARSARPGPAASTSISSSPSHSTTLPPLMTRWAEAMSVDDVLAEVARTPREPIRA